MTDKRLDQLPFNSASADCVIYGEENSTTSVKLPVNSANGLAGLDANGLVPIANLPESISLFVFNVKNYGAVGNGSTDDTVAIQDAINACATAGGGIVYFPAGVYIVAGALQNTSTSNSQLTLSSVAFSSTSITILLLGSVPPSTTVAVNTAIALPITGSIIQSTLSSGTGALLGIWGSVSAPTFSNINIKIENLGFRMVSNPTNTAIDMTHAAGLEITNVAVDCGNYFTLGNTFPTTTTSYGVKTPANNNGAYTQIQSLTVVGFYKGLQANEHTTGSNIGIWACAQAIEVPTAYHALHLGRVLIVHCPRGIVPTGTVYIDIAQLDTEYVTSGSFARVYDIDDASNSGNGFIRWHNVQSSVGVEHSFLVNGATGFQVSEVGATIGGAYYYYRVDDLTASGGETGITLAAALYQNDIQLTKQVASGTSALMLQNQYSITTSTSITFTTPATAGDIYTTAYRTLTPSPGASTLIVPVLGHNLDPSNTPNGTLSNSNRTVTNTGGGGICGSRSINSHSSGKWYAEIHMDSNPSTFDLIGIGNSSANISNGVGKDANGWAYYQQNGNIMNNNSQTAYGASFATGDVIQIFWDADDGKLYFGKNNTIQNSGNLTAGTGFAFNGLSGAMYVILWPQEFNADVMTVAFTASQQTYSAPSGYTAWDD